MRPITLGMNLFGTKTCIKARLFALTGVFLCLAGTFNGCAVVALSLLGAGAGVITGQAMSYSLDGIAYRTFTAPLLQTERATLAALRRMGIKVESVGKAEEGNGRFIKAVGAERQIEVGLEPVSKGTTRMRTVAKQGMFFRDRATAAEIILQTEKILGGSSPSRTAGSVDPIISGRGAPF